MTDLDFWDCFGMKKKLYSLSNAVVFKQMIGQQYTLIRVYTSINAADGCNSYATFAADKILEQNLQF